jgi:hypothetical protein
MAKRITEKPKPTQEELLRACLLALEAMAPQLGRLGGNEQREFYRHADKLKVCLQGPEAVMAAAWAFIETQKTYIEKCQANDRVREELAAAVAEAEKVAAEAHRAEVARKIEAAEERRLAGLAK